MKKLIKFAVNNPITILMAVLGIMLLGKISYDKLSVDLLPDLNNPKLYVDIAAGERPPEEIEKLFVKRMESMAIRQRDVLFTKSFSISSGGRSPAVISTYNLGLFRSGSKSTLSLSYDILPNNMIPNTAIRMVIGLFTANFIIFFIIQNYF